MGNENRQRELRKNEHIQAVQILPDQGGAGFEDVVLLPESACEVDCEAVSLVTQFLGYELRSPIIINAMTGGTEEALQINRRLARVARRHGLAMAVGSETAGLRDVELAPSYTIAREVHPDGVLIANVGMGANPEIAQKAVDLVGANLLQVHWNTAQELFMPEGDRHFRGMLEQLQRVCQRSSVPVIAKEVGQGMTADSAERFVRMGVQALDVGGMGGTNFIAVEAWRRGIRLDPEWQQWGIPTVASLGEVIAGTDSQVAVVASGGVRNGHDIAKCLAMGASAVGIAGPFLRLAAQADSDRELDQWLEDVHRTLKLILVLTGSATLAELGQRPVIVRGNTREWLRQRGFDSYLQALARRSRPV